jgi:hypothetical protein
MADVHIALESMQNNAAAMDKKFPQSPPRSPVSRRSTPWHAVSIVTGRWCCEAARGVIGTRFLSREAPRLPLAACNAADSCSCLYKHHPDRRGLPRRKDEVMGIRRLVSVPNERRSARGRREDD